MQLIEGKIFLGIDPGLNNTGWGMVLYGGKDSFEYVDSGVISTKSNLLQAERLKIIFDGVMEKLELYKPSYAAIENTYVNINNASSLKLAQAKAAALIALAKGGININEYPAKTIKKIVTGSGNADKEQVKKMMQIWLPNKYIENADEADAVAIALCDALSNKMKLKFL
jgi:crossover junction endodeoxyribonuclease RuvC